MKRILVMILSLLALALTPVVAMGDPEKTVGIVMPLDHAALRAIIEGFEKSVSSAYPGKVHFQIANAEHDLNIQRSIIQKFINQKVDLIVPLGTSTTQMAIIMVKNQPVIGLAANFPESVRRQDNLAQRFTAVPDEIDADKLMAFLHAILPQAQKLTLIYSSEDKVIRAVAETKEAARKNNIAIQPLMILNLSDLYSVSHQAARDSQGIFILKDNLVASGINTLIRVANERHIPLITSDEDTVRAGAAVALGVEEKQIGEEGGKLAAQLFRGDSLRQMPIQSIPTLQIFLNEKAAKKQGLKMEDIKNYALQNQYQIKYPGLTPGVFSLLDFAPREASSRGRPKGENSHSPPLETPIAQCYGLTPTGCG